MKKLFIVLSLNAYMTAAIAMDGITSNENEGFQGKKVSSVKS